MTIFQQIIDGTLPADIVYRDDLTIAFRDIRPVAPTHILVIPLRHITSLSAIKQEDSDLLGHLLWVAAQVARKEGLDENGYRLIVNNGIDAGQSVDHIHIHIVGGRALGWPPG